MKLVLHVFLLAYPIWVTSPSVVKWVTHLPGALIIRVLAWIRDIHSDSDDHCSDGLVSLSTKLIELICICNLVNFNLTGLADSKILH